MADYEKVCDYMNLYNAHVSLRKGKRNKPECVKFELDLMRNLSDMHEQLVNKSYKMQGYYHFQVHEPKTRDVFAAYYPDRVLLNCICDQVVKPILMPRLIYDNAACQLNKGTHFAQKRLTKFLAEHYKYHGTSGYVLKCDIAQYFASIDHTILKSKIEKLITDEEVRNLLYQFIDNHHTEGKPGVGIPLGNQSSQWFALYYLDEVDRFIKEKLQVRHYIRYMDDLLLIHTDLQFLKVALEQIRSLIEGELKLSLNSKTQIFPLRNGVEFLGWRFHLSPTGKIIKTLKKQTKYRFKRRLSEMQKEYANGKIEYEDVRCVLAGYNGHLKHGHAYKFQTKNLQEFSLRKSSS